MDIHVRIRLVIRHVIEHAINTEGGTIRDAKSQANEPAGAVIIDVPHLGIVRTIELVTGAGRAGADDELALSSHQVAKREVVVQTKCECMGVDVFRLSTQAADDAIRITVVWRVVAVAFDLEAGIGKKYTDAPAIAKTILGYRAGTAGVLIEPCPLGKAANFDGAGKRRIEIIPPYDRGPERAAARRRPATEHRAEIRRELNSSLSANVEIARLREIIEQRVKPDRETAESKIESRGSLNTKIVRARSRSIGKPDVLQNTTGTDVERGHVAKREVVHETRRDRRVLLFRRAFSASDRCVHPVSFEIQLRRDESANAPTITESVKLEVVFAALIVEIRVLPEAAYQQRSWRLCCRRSAEEQGRHRTDGQTSSQHKVIPLKRWNFFPAVTAVARYIVKRTHCLVSAQHSLGHPSHFRKT